MSESSRVERFSDAVFAITLLILEIKVPEVGTHSDLWDALGRSGPRTPPMW
jgi:uncharacterized membrane protein